MAGVGDTGTGTSHGHQPHRLFLGPIPAPNHHWAGHSFQVPAPAPVPAPVSDVRRVVNDSELDNAPHVHVHTESVTPTTGADTFVTAPLIQVSSTSAHTTTTSADDRPYHPPTPSSSTALLPSESSPPASDRNASKDGRPPAPPRSNSTGSKLQSALLSRGDPHLAPPNAKRNGTSSLQVHYDLVPEGTSSQSSSTSQATPPAHTQSPLPPQAVLERTNSGLEDTSAGAAANAIGRNDIFAPEEGTDVVLRDRMLVRVSYSKLDNVGQYDEAHSRTMAHLQYEDWAQFLVVWRKNRVEFYEDYSFRLKEHFTKHKKLAFVVPLEDPAKTKVSLYSDVDYSFSLTCPPTCVRTKGENQKTGLRSLLHRAKRGTNIFVCKPKTRSRAADWLWKLWMKLGGELPPTLDVYVPALDRRIQFNVPLSDPDSSRPPYSAFTREAVLEQCTAALCDVPEYKLLYEERVAQGAKFELAWRRGMKLDWVWLDEDANGVQKDWGVLYSLAAKPSGEVPHLEFRFAEHQPSHLRLRRSSTVLSEPPAIEGYLWRIRASSTTKIPVYLSTHDGYIFSIKTTQARPPTPPDLDITTPADSVVEGDTEHQRVVEHLFGAYAFTDLRAVVAVRRAFQLVAVADSPDDAVVPEAFVVDGGHDHHIASMSAIPNDEEASTNSDDEDQGGDDGLANSTDRPYVRMKRSFELVMRNGHIVRYEAHSRRVALEWITRLRALISYWTQRHLADAAQEMDLLRYSTGVDDVTSRMRQAHRHGRPVEPSRNPEAASLLLGTFWNWCIIEECRVITKSGRLFVRRGLKGQYRLMYLVLTSGHIMQFQFVTGNRAMQYPRTQVVNLLDAYVCSGRFAAQTLPPREYDPNAPPVARRYQDGLQSIDSDEDTLLMIWYYPQAARASTTGTASLTTSNSNRSMGTSYKGPTASAPRLGSKRHLLVLKARSKLERDAWCWALNCEIEKVVRVNREREQSVRNSGGLVNY